MTRLEGTISNFIDVAKKLNDVLDDFKRNSPDKYAEILDSFTFPVGDGACGSDRNAWINAIEELATLPITAGSEFGRIVRHAAIHYKLCQQRRIIGRNVFLTLISCSEVLHNHIWAMACPKQGSIGGARARQSERRT